MHTSHPMRHPTARRGSYVTGWIRWSHEGPCAQGANETMGQHSAPNIFHAGIRARFSRQTYGRLQTSRMDWFCGGRKTE